MVRTVTLTIEHFLRAIFEVQLHEYPTIVGIVGLPLIDTAAATLTGRFEFCGSENLFDLGLHGILVNKDSLFPKTRHQCFVIAGAIKSSLSRTVAARGVTDYEAMWRRSSGERCQLLNEAQL